MISVDLIGIQVDPVSGAAAVVLREQAAPNRLLPIIVGTSDAGSIAIAASGQRLPRPMAHDLMAALVEGLDGHLDSVEVTELHDGAFFAELTVSGPAGERRIDTRPSDAIALAIRLRAPLFVSEQVLDEAGALPIDEPETDQVAIEVAIDAEVDQFRAFLAELDPDDFIETSATESPTSTTEAAETETSIADTADSETADADADSDVETSAVDPDTAVTETASTETPIVDAETSTAGTETSDVEADVGDVQDDDQPG